MATASLQLFFSTFLFAALLIEGRITATHSPVLVDQRPSSSVHHQINNKDDRGWSSSIIFRSGRRMIGSTAPTCTYNECKGCKFKCVAEQIPVDGNDPIHSAYHYKCVCHRYFN